MSCTFRVLRSRELAKEPMVVAISEKAEAKRFKRKARRLTQELRKREKRRVHVKPQ